MLLSVCDVEKTFAEAGRVTPVLRGVSFDMGAGETVALRGESGSGKSTLLHLIATLDQPTKGRILLDGVDVAGLSDARSAALRRDRVGIVFQQFNLIPSLSARSNIAFHARLAARYDPQVTEHLAEKLGLAEHLDKYPEALSGGQQQRVAIARTLAARPRLILADEPTGNLDEDTADRVLALMLESAAEVGAAVLMVTHSTRLAQAMSRSLSLSHGVVAEQGADRATARAP